MPTTLLLVPPNFQTFLRPWYKYMMGGTRTILLRGLDALTMRPCALVIIFSVIFPLSWASAVYTKFPILPIDETRQGNKARVPYDLRREVSTYSDTGNHWMTLVSI